jgi:DNA invertase Pin-like site-specific DNA recombinase
MKTLAVGYCRVSSIGQKKTGAGLERQAKDILTFAKKNNYRIQKVYKEAFTGTETARPVFETMVADLLSNGIRTIIVECLDRLARDLAIQLQLIALLASKGITLINAMTGQDVTNPTDAMTKAMIQIQGTFAELDKNLLIRKLKKGRQAKKEKTGSCEGRKPFGYYDNEKEILARIRDLHRKPQGKPRRGPSEIARTLNDEKRFTRKGTKWTRQAIHQVIKYNGWHS